VKKNDLATLNKNLKEIKNSYVDLLKPEGESKDLVWTNDEDMLYHKKMLMNL